MTLLQDGNCAIYPLAKDCIDSIRDPLWLDLSPAVCIGIGMHSLPNVGAAQKNKVAVIVLVLEVA